MEAHDLPAPATLPPTLFDARGPVTLRPHVDSVLRAGGGRRYVTTPAGAVDRDLRRDVALRRMPRAAARRLGRLEHPNIIPVHDAGATSDGRPFCVVKRVEGRLLSELERTPLDVVMRVCDALAFAHAQGAAHGALRSECVFVGDFGDVIVDGWADGAIADDVRAAATMVPGGAPELEAIRRASYGSILELQADLRRYQEGHEVSVRRDPPLTRAVKWVKRNPIPSAAIAAALAALVVGVVLTRAHAQAGRRARVAQLLSQRTMEAAWGALSLEPENARARALIEELSVERHEAERRARRAEAREHEARADALLSEVPPMSDDRDVRRGAIQTLLAVDEQLRKAHELAGEPPARRVEAARLLGEWALSGKDYALARMAYSIVGSTGKVDREEVAEANRQAGRIERALDELADPPKVRAPDALYLADWIYEVVGYRDAQTARMLGEALGPHIEKARREGREVRWTQPQREVLKFCFEVLGRIERPESVGPLAAMMEVIRDREVELVVGCGLALCNTRDARAEGPLLAARDRLGLNSQEWSQIARSFARLPEPQGAPEPVTAVEFANRGLARKARGNLAGAIQDYSRAIELDPKDARAFNNRGLARKDGGDLAGAIEDYSRAIDLDPKHALAFNNRGLARQARGDLAGAIEDYSRAIELEPKLAMAFNNRGVARADRGDLAGAIEDHSQAIDLDPKDAPAFNNRGIARQARGDFAGAIEDYGRVIELDPKNTAAFNNRGNARKARGDLAGSIEDYSRAIELDPKDATAFNNRGNARRNRGDLAGAIEDYGRAIELHPKFAAAFYNRGVARSDSGDLAGAIEDYGRAIELDPKDAATFYNRGVARQARGELAGAIQDYSRAIELDPKLAAAFCNRGIAREARGDIPGAIADWTRFLELAPDHPDAPAVRAAGEAARLRLSEQEDY